MDIEDFINNYTQKDKAKIDINFVAEQDTNCAFRDSVSKELTTKQIGSLELIRDIFFIEDEYFKVKDISFDTSCAIDAYGLRLEEILQGLNEIKQEYKKKAKEYIFKEVGKIMNSYELEDIINRYSKSENFTIQILDSDEPSSVNYFLKRD